MKYAVMFEPFDFEGLKYVHETDDDGGGWSIDNKVKSFNTKEEAEKETKKWNTAVVVEYEGENK